MTTLLQSLVFLPAVPTFASVMAMVNLLAILNGGVSEMRGNHGQYSKLASASNSGPKIRSKLGMTFFYFPAFAFGTASFFIFPTYLQDTRFFLLRAAITLHFFKRLLEERSKILFKFVDLVEKHIEELAYLETWDNGKPYKQALLSDS